MQTSFFMQSISDFFEALLNGGQLIHYGGLTVIIIIIFVETGLFFGFFLPRDYLLFTAGLLCGTKDFNISIFTTLNILVKLLLITIISKS